MSEKIIGLAALPAGVVKRKYAGKFVKAQDDGSIAETRKIEERSGIIHITGK